MAGGYRDRRVYRLAHQLGVAVHKMTDSLARLDMIEQGMQIRRSSKRVSTAIVEAFSMKNYPQEFEQALHRGYAAAGVTLEYLDYLRETEALAEGTVYEKLRTGYQEVRRLLLKEIQQAQRSASGHDVLQDEETADNIDISTDV